MKSKTIVFIHGMYMTPLCWEHWLDYFQAKGYHCIAPAWPGRDKPIETL
jgi:alpha-beta hydrolase superfamily lysophospholipase